MAIFKNVTMYWVKLDPKKPAPAFGDGGPKWEFQARTKDKAQAKEWKDNFINVKLVQDDDTGEVYNKASFRKATTKANGEAQLPVKVVNGSLEEIDPNTVGNGSICNIRVFQYDYEVKSKQPGGPSKKGKATMLMQVQITKLVKYVPKPRDDDFEMTETEVVDVADTQEHDNDADEFVEVTAVTPAAVANKGPAVVADVNF